MMDVNEALKRLKEIGDNRPDLEHTGSPGYMSEANMARLQEAYDNLNKQEVEELTRLIKALSRVPAKNFTVENV